METTDQTILDCVGKPIDIEASTCPVCGVVNLPWCDIEHLLPESDSTAESWDVPGIGKVTCGTACWDSTWGDTCGACRNKIVNPEKWPSVFGL